MLDPHYEYNTVRGHRFSVKDLLDIPESKGVAAPAPIAPPSVPSCMSPPQGHPHPRPLGLTDDSPDHRALQAQAHPGVFGSVGGHLNHESDVSRLQHIYYDSDNPYTRWLQSNDPVHYNRK